MRRSKAETTGTPALTALAKAGVEHHVHAYKHDPGSDVGYGLEAAIALGVDPFRVFKTLVTNVEGRLVVAVVPVNGQLALKAVASAVGAKRATMAEVGAAERATGYVAGGISPLGHRRRLPVVVDTSATGFDTVYVSAGRRGLDIEMRPADLVSLAHATVASIRRGPGP